MQVEKKTCKTNKYSPFYFEYLSPFKKRRALALFFVIKGAIYLAAPLQVVIIL